jgi:hypothetical protein
MRSSLAISLCALAATNAACNCPPSPPPDHNAVQPVHDSADGPTTAPPPTTAQRGPSQWHEAAKIKFRLDDIHSDGLRGRPDNLVSVDYEFCVPADDRVYQDVQRIDPSVRIQRGARGRIGCSEDEALCIGNTHSPRWREALEGLSALAYIA